MTDELTQILTGMHIPQPCILVSYVASNKVIAIRGEGDTVQDGLPGELAYQGPLDTSKSLAPSLAAAATYCPLGEKATR